MDARCSMHAAALMLSHSQGSIVSTLSRRHIRAAALTQPHLTCTCRHIHATACKPPHSRRTYATAFTKPHLCCSAYTAALFHCTHAATLVPLLSRCDMYATTFTPPHARRSIHAAHMPPHSRSSTHAAALTRPHCFASLALPHWCRRSHAAAPRTPPHFGCSINAAAQSRTHAAEFTPSHLRCRLRTAAFTLQLSRGRFAGVDEDHLKRIFQRGILCTYISPRGVCNGRVKNRGLGWDSVQKETPSGQKETPSGQLLRKVGKRI